jgi:hypothetical protein
VVSVTNPYGRIIGFIDRSLYFFGFVATFSKTRESVIKYTSFANRLSFSIRSRYMYL